MTKLRIPLLTRQDYEAALQELNRVQSIPIGMPGSERAQQLVEAIIDYEDRQMRNGRAH